MLRYPHAHQLSIRINLLVRIPVPYVLLFKVGDFALLLLTDAAIVATIGSRNSWEINCYVDRNRSNVVEIIFRPLLGAERTLEIITDVPCGVVNGHIPEDDLMTTSSRNAFL